MVASVGNLTKAGKQREPAGTEFSEQKDRHVRKTVTVPFTVTVKGTVRWPQRFSTEFGCAAFGRFVRKPDESWTTERTAGTEFIVNRKTGMLIVIVKGTVADESECAAFGRFIPKPDESWTTDRTSRDRV